MEKPLLLTRIGAARVEVPGVPMDLGLMAPVLRLFSFYANWGV